MSVRFASILALACCSCMGFNIIPSVGDSTSSSGGGDASSSDDTSEAGADGSGGINCGVDPDTGVTLCSGNSACPGVTVDPDLFPGCGFRIDNANDVIDLECACYGQICPIGVATTCAQATALMQNQSQYTVCMQVDEGRCTAN
jgi:hypothetical protein